ncbi:MAG: DUF4258 domain-containing protein [Verrucomicrobiota bacterium]|nr:DUF4258 domain-containing protein [Verrucomicrobiota bacterium]
MNLIYTEYVLQRMAKRQLRKEWIERAVCHPSRIESDEVDATLEHPLAPVP